MMPISLGDPAIQCTHVSPASTAFLHARIHACSSSVGLGLGMAFQTSPKAFSLRGRRALQSWRQHALFRLGLRFSLLFQPSAGPCCWRLLCGRRHESRIPACPKPRHPSHGVLDIASQRIFLDPSVRRGSISFQDSSLHICGGLVLKLGYRLGISEI